MGGGCWNHPYHCHRPRANCAPTQSGGSTAASTNVTNVTVINIINIINNNPSGPVVPQEGTSTSGGTGANGGSGNAQPAQPSKYDAIYLIDLWEQGTFPQNSDEKDWRSQPAAKAIWYYSNAKLETMNAGPLPDREFQVPGDLPNGFDWEAYTIGMS